MIETEPQQPRSEVMFEQLKKTLPLIERNKLDMNLSMLLTAEKDDKGEPTPGEAYWLSLRTDEGVVEGKLFAPNSGSNKLVLFEPGMPGDSNTWMEGKHVPKLLEAGYSVFCVRHNGTQINSERSQVLVGCPERVDVGDTEEIDLIGDNDKISTIEDIDREPEIALRVLSKNFEEIYMVGHSNGASGELFSMTNLPPEITDKIRSFTALSGFIGEYDHETDYFDREGRFNGESLLKYYEYCNQYLNMGDSVTNVELAKSIFKRIYSQPLPEHIQVNLITSPEDEYISMQSAQDYQDYIGRGLRVKDKTQDTADFHDLKNLTPETLIRVMEIYHPKGKHSVTFGDESGNPFANS